MENGQFDPKVPAACSLVIGLCVFWENYEAKV